MSKERWSIADKDEFANVVCLLPNELDECLEFLDDLRRHAKKETDMYGAVPFLQGGLIHLGLSDIYAREILLFWMDTFGERHSDE